MTTKKGVVRAKPERWAAGAPSPTPGTTVRVCGAGTTVRVRGAVSRAR
jgi:hypothetical protein